MQSPESDIQWYLAVLAATLGVSTVAAFPADGFDERNRNRNRVRCVLDGVEEAVMVCCSPARPTWEAAAAEVMRRVTAIVGQAAVDAAVASVEAAAAARAEAAARPPPQQNASMAMMAAARQLAVEAAPLSPSLPGER
eukprot:scaffold68657_cov18-Tisochrysis_lutea.AAC.1